MTIRELCEKEVVQLEQGACLGRADDLEFDPATARLQRREPDHPMAGDRDYRHGCGAGAHPAASGTGPEARPVADGAHKTGPLSGSVKK